MDEKGLGHRLQQARKTAGLTQQSLCQIANLSYSTLAKIERGAIKAPSIFTIQSIADALHVQMCIRDRFKAANISYLGHKKDGSRIAFEHANFGLLLGQDGKKLSSRKGTSGSLVEVIDEVYTHAFDETTKHNPDMPENEAQRIAEKLATAAVVWNDLKTDRTSSVKFDIDQMLNLETGTVLDVAYTYSRSLSILSRAEDLLESLATVEPLFTEDAERQLVAAFSNFKDVILKSANERAPHHLVAYMQGLSLIHI